MLRGLVVRQGFMIAEGILGLVIVGIAVLAIRDLYSPPVTLGSMNPVVESGAGSLMLESPVESRASYDSILTSKIFGAAAGYVHNAAPVKKPVAVKPVNPVTEDTKLPLTLKGTLYAGEDSLFSSANILISGKGAGLQTFFVGDEVVENVYLLKVSKNEVLLDNKRANKHERLKHELDLKIAAKGAGSITPTTTKRSSIAAARPTPSGRPTQSKLITLDRKTITKKMEDAYERLASTVDVLEVKDDDGNLQGISTPNIESIPELSELGFKNGDVLVSVNNEKVTGQDQMASLANKYRNSTVVRVGILRGGQPMNFTYRLR